MFCVIDGAALAELERLFNHAIDNLIFLEGFRSFYPYPGRPSSLHKAEQLTERARKQSKRGLRANIYFKREDLNYTTLRGLHEIHNAIDQARK